MKGQSLWQMTGVECQLNRLVPRLKGGIALNEYKIIVFFLHWTQFNWTQSRSSSWIRSASTPQRACKLHNCFWLAFFLSCSQSSPLCHQADISTMFSSLGASGGLVDAGPAYEKNLAEELTKLQRLYGGGDITAFPEFKFTG